MEILRTFIRKIVHWAMTPNYKFATCGSNVRIGYGFFVNYPDRLYFENDISIGAYASINSLGGVKIRSGTIIGPYCHVYSANHRYFDSKLLPFDQDQYLNPVEIGENVWIGVDVIILPGVSIKEGAVIGAGSVVVKDVEAGHVVAGNPAKTIKKRDMEHYIDLKSKNSIFMNFIHTNKLSMKSFINEIGKIPADWNCSDQYLDKYNEK